MFSNLLCNLFVASPGSLNIPEGSYLLSLELTLPRYVSESIGDNCCSSVRFFQGNTRLVKSPYLLTFFRNLYKLYVLYIYLPVAAD